MRIRWDAVLAVAVALSVIASATLIIRWCYPDHGIYTWWMFGFLVATWLLVWARCASAGYDEEPRRVTIAKAAGWIGSIVLLLIALFVWAGCADDARSFRLQEGARIHVTAVLSGQHRLRKMQEKDGQAGSLSGSFFLVVGGISGEEHPTTDLLFAWETSPEVYQITRWPMTKVQICMTPDATAPTIQWDYSLPSAGHWDDWAYGDANDIIEHAARKLVIFARPQDWPVQIDLPLNH